MADDRSITGSAATEGAVHDDDELAEVLAAELERYSTGTVPVLPRTAAPAPREDLIQPLAVPRIDVPADEAPSVVVDDGAFARRAAEVERAMRAVQQPVQDAPIASGTFRRSDRPTGRRSATGPILQPSSLPTADDLPVKRRTGFRPPPSAVDLPPVEPLERVLPTGPISLPEPTASLLDAMITGSIPTIDALAQRTARHAAPPTEPTSFPAPVSQPVMIQPPEPEPAAPPQDEQAAYYEDWEQSLRSIGRPRAPWEVDDEIVPTGGDPDLATVAVPVQRTAPVAPTTEENRILRRGAHAMAEQAAPVDPVEDPAETPRRSGRRRAAAPVDEYSQPIPMPVVVPEAMPVVHEPVADDWFAPRHDLPVTVAIPQPDGFEEPERVADGLFDADEEGIDEIAVDYPVVSAATTGAIDLPQVEARPRTAPVVLIERVRTALLQLPTVPPSPTGSGAAAIVGRWVGAFASPLVLVLAFGLAAAGSGPAAIVAMVAGALLAVPAIVRTTSWSARTTDDADLHETAVLGAGAGRAVAVVLLLARLGAAATALFATGSIAGAWADRTGALGLGSSNAALLGCTAVGLLAILCSALPTRATAVLTLLVAVIGAVGTLLVALVLAPTGGTAVVPTASGTVAAGGAGLVAIGLLVVLCGADVARWRTDLANPVSTAVGSAVAVLCGVVIASGGTLIAARLTGGGDAVDEFAGALSDASASLLAGPMLLILLLSAITLPVLLLRSAGATAARLLGGGRPVRLGTVAAGLLALAGALGLLAAGVSTSSEVLAAAALCGAPVAAWAGVLMTTGAARRPVIATAGIAVGSVAGWALSDGVLPGVASPLLAAVPASTGLHGGPVLGLVVALVIGAIGGALSGSARSAARRPVAGPADTVEG